MALGFGSHNEQTKAISKKIKPEDRITHLRSQIDIVKTFFENYNIHIPFFIAGGSIFSILNCQSFQGTDIDVYFYSKDDFEIVKSRLPQDILDSAHVTNKAYTFHWVPKGLLDNNSCVSDCTDVFDLAEDSKSENNSSRNYLDRPIQLIVKEFGTPEYIFEYFDFNCSKCAYTSNYDVVTSKDFSKYIHFDPDNMHGDILRRYAKYVEHKGAIDTDNKTIFKLLDFFIENKDVKLKVGYGQMKEVLALAQLGNFLNSSYESYIPNYIHDKIVQTYGPEERMEIFENLFEYFTTLTIPACDEFNFKRLQFVDNNQDMDYTPWKANSRKPYLESKYFATLEKATIQHVRYKYAEYFI